VGSRDLLPVARADAQQNLRALSPDNRTNISAESSLDCLE
jgi:hypothetical protein